MASGFFALFDDIALLMDDVATVGQTATQKTAGILGDDLAVTAEKASGFLASRELPVIWAIFKGSIVNKLIILPLAFLLSAFAPWLIAPILMLGGTYLAFEGIEAIYGYLFHKKTHPSKQDVAETRSRAEVLNDERAKIKSAIRTDFILSIEIVIIALSTVSGYSLPVQVAVVTFVAFIATVAVYGLVALLVRMDDFGYRLVALSRERTSIIHRFGQLLIAALPKVIRALAVIGTIAMLLVAGGIFMHHIETLHHLLHTLPSLLAELLTGAVVGIVVLIPVELFHWVKQR